MEPARPRCPICNKEIAPRPQNSAAPFCSPQCRMVDLGKWLDGDYRVASDDIEETEKDVTGRGDREEPS